ncbi:MAG TPA: 50S ribosomal protein L11 methyltransferase [Xanthobacteraceae bacterium]|nr:50S ribosomal protein L11 methyltransferase [Xanthobacteraceae bacterium]
MPRHPNPNPKTYVARLPAAETEARRIANLLTESLDPTLAVCAAFEAPDGWQVEVHFVAPLDASRLRTLVASAAGPAHVKALRIAPAPARDWVAAGLAGLPPVEAGRYFVHGSHDRARVPINRIAIEIEAALAFGTGHHGTTRGCLLAIDALMKRNKPRNILDLGTGSGVLAIAAAKTLRTRVLATDIDSCAVRTARHNARHNHVGVYVETIGAAGLLAPRFNACRRFDLVLANILLAPLQRLAAPLARRLAPEARIVLSGLLPAHANAAIAVYRAQNLALERRIECEGWTTLVMKRPQPGAATAPSSVHRFVFG